MPEGRIGKRGALFEGYGLRQLRFKMSKMTAPVYFCLRRAGASSSRGDKLVECLKTGGGEA